MSDTIETDAVIANPLRASGLVDSAALEKARAFRKEHGGLLSDALLRLNLVKEGDFLRIFAEFYNTKFVKAEKLKTLKLDDETLERCGARLAERLRMCPIRWDAERSEIHIVAAIPLSSAVEPEARKAWGARTVLVYVASAGAVSALIRRWFYSEVDAFEQVTANGAGPLEVKPRPDLPPEAEQSAQTVVVETTHSGETQTSHRSLDASATADTQTSARTVPPTGKFDVRAATEAFNNETATIATLRRENLRYRAAQEFHRRVAQERTVEAMVDRVLSALFELLPAEGAAIWLNSGALAVRGRRPGQKVDVPRSIVDQTLISSGGVLVHNALVDERFERSESVMVRGVQSVMAVPLRVSGRTLGVLYVDSISQSAAFTEDDLALLESIGSQAAIMLDNAELIVRVQQEVENRASLARFLSPAAVEEVLHGRMKLKLDGQAAEVTVLFADIRGFTRLASELPPEEVVRFLNAFFTEMVDVVDKHHGTVDKFIGDCVMALWGAPTPNPDDPLNALACALEMVERCRPIYVQGRPMEIGIGVNTGEVVLGAIGSRQRVDYTAIGSPVNLAARLCGIARSGEVLVTTDTLIRAGQGVFADASEPVILKGLDMPLVPYVLRSVPSRGQAQPIPLTEVAVQDTMPHPALGGPKRGR